MFARMKQRDPLFLRDGTATRTVILHYHLFKNAGTSVEELLRRNFGSGWISQEFPLPRRNNVAALAEFLRTHAQVIAVSSHTALLPVPHIDGVDVFPIIFIRHPIDRLRSAYEFERRQVADTPGARLAKSHDFAGYVRGLLKQKHHRQARNFQTFRLSHIDTQHAGSERARAFLALSRLPFVGLVEDFDHAVHRLEQKLRPKFPYFRVETAHFNSSRSRETTLAERLASIRARLGTSLFTEICDANQDDLAIYAALEHVAEPEKQVAHAAKQSPASKVIS